MTIHLSRRDLLQAGIALAATGLTRRLNAQGGSSSPHFFLQVVIPGGADNLYMFDSRPLSFTGAGKMANYSGAEPSLWEGANGGRCFASPFAAALKPYKGRLAVVNGIHMPPGFEGHDQNVNALLSANPFGGKYFGPFLAKAGRPLDFVSLGSLFGANVSNKERSLTMSAGIAPGLADKAAQVGQAGGEPPWRQWVSARANACGGGDGMLSEGCRSYRDSLLASQSLAQKLAKTKVDFGTDVSEIIKGAKVAFKYFSEGVVDVCLVVADGIDFDTHAEKDAAKSPEFFTKLCQNLASLFEALVKTPFDAASGLSMMDVTTVMISSEFARTHGQSGKAVDKTGTDHNPQSNMVILAGKGIKGDLVVGESDCDALGADGNFANISAAHKSLDSGLLKRMGKAYDFDAGSISTELPTEYKIDHYISMASVINTVLSGFSVPKDAWMTNDPSRQGGEQIPAKPIVKLLT